MPSQGRIFDLAACTPVTEQMTSLVKTAHLELLRLVIRRDSNLPIHEAEGEIVFQCLDGWIEVRFWNEIRLLSSRQLLYLDRGVPFSLHGKEDSSALLTIIAPKRGENVELIGGHQAS